MFPISIWYAETPFHERMYGRRAYHLVSFNHLFSSTLRIAVLHYLGVALLIPQPDDQNTVPNVLPGTSTRNRSYSGGDLDLS